MSCTIIKQCPSDTQMDSEAPCHGPYPLQLILYLSTNKIVLRDQAVHFQAKVNRFFHHGHCPFSSSHSIRAALCWCFQQASLSGNKWHQYLDNTFFMIHKMAALTLSLMAKPLSCGSVVDTPPHLDPY